MEEHVVFRDDVPIKNKSGLGILSKPFIVAEEVEHISHHVLMLLGWYVPMVCLYHNALLIQMLKESTHMHIPV